ncbi:MAG: zinc ribbon domain-containing protein, partial [Planctomycetes bacterium]|nr:zinc ribbon domain-containing protein [Planctomycetota bacterium]
MPTDSTSTLATCQNCGAQAKRLDARFCEYCGTELPVAEVPHAESSRRFSGTRDVDARLEALASHTDWARLQALNPEDAGKAGVAGGAFSIIFLVLWIGIGGTVTAGFAAVG